MKRFVPKYLLLMLAATWICPVAFQVSYAQDRFITDSSGFVVRLMDNDVFGPGERFVFDVKYGIIKGGEAGIEILPELVTYREAPCLHLHTWAKSSKTFSAFFKVDDQIHAYMDARGLFSWYFEKRLNEGSYHDVKVVDYDQRLGKAFMVDDGVPKDTGDISLYVQDALSILYYFRLQPLQVGQTLYADVYDIKKLYPLRVDVLAREKVKVPAGTFLCLKVEPKLESAGIFKGKGKLTLWFTDDARRLPVQMQTKVLIGHISAELKSYTSGAPVDQSLLISQEAIPALRDTLSDSTAPPDTLTR